MKGNKARFVCIFLAGALCLNGCANEMVRAGYNTLLGMGMAFFVLALVSALISVLPLFTALFNKSESVKPRVKKRRITRGSEEEIAAVISAALAAAERDGGIGEYYIKSVTQVE